MTTAEAAIGTPIDPKAKTRGRGVLPAEGAAAPAAGIEAI
jgi:hypothetical protein